MAREARRACREAASAGLLVAATACAVVQEPPGGPPDFEPPKIVGVNPDSGTVVPGLRDPVRIEFDEVIDERSGGGLSEMVVLSPRPEELKVRWKRTAIEVEPDGGWRPGTIYHLSLLPGIADLRNNRLDSGRTVIFSTGGELPHGRIEGTVIDWEAGRPRAALIEAALLPDSLVYVSRADSAGDFRLSEIPPGRYHLVATLDDNNNRRRDPREAFDSVTVVLDSALSQILWAFNQDSVGPQIRNVNLIDSLTVNVRFGRMLEPGSADSLSVLVWALPDTTPVAVAHVWEQATYDSVKAAEAARAKIAAEDTAAADTTTLEAADTTIIGRLLSARPALSDTWVVRVAEPLVPGSRYLIEARARSVARAFAQSRTVLIVPESGGTP
ncbi:MAG: Ig-like domain-containing protein [Gemmatimonadales bacterium]